MSRDPRESLRGVPVVGPGCGMAAIKHTQPEYETVRAITRLERLHELVVEKLTDGASDAGEGA